MACRMTRKNADRLERLLAGDAVTRLDLKYVYRYRDRHGKCRQYLRRPGCRSIPLPGAWGSPEFMAAYQAAIATPTEPPAKPGVTVPGTMQAFAVEFFKSVEFSNLKPSSQRIYRLVIESVCQLCGNRAACRAKRPKRLTEIGASRKAMANLTRDIMRRLMECAIDQGMRSDDPSPGSRLTSLAPNLDRSRALCL
jgi:hypothetical protein